MVRVRWFIKVICFSSVNTNQINTLAIFTTLIWKMQPLFRVEVGSIFFHFNTNPWLSQRMDPTKCVYHKYALVKMKQAENVKFIYFNEVYLQHLERIPGSAIDLCSVSISVHCGETSTSCTSVSLTWNKCLNSFLVQPQKPRWVQSSLSFIWVFQFQKQRVACDAFPWI